MQKSFVLHTIDPDTNKKVKTKQKKNMFYMVIFTTAGSSSYFLFRRLDRIGSQDDSKKKPCKYTGG